MRGVVCLGPVVGAAQQVVLCEEWITAPRHLAGQEAVAHWLHRYVLSHGPVAPSEFSWWTKLLRRDIAPELDAVRETVLTVAVDGRELWMAPDLPERYAAARRASAAPLLLLPGFDEMLLGYGDRCAMLTRDEERLLVPGGNGMFLPSVLHRGRVVGTWRPPPGPGSPCASRPSPTCRQSCARRCRGSPAGCRSEAAQLRSRSRHIRQASRASRLKLWV